MDTNASSFDQPAHAYPPPNVQRGSAPTPGSASSSYGSNGGGRSAAAAASFFGGGGYARVESSTGPGSVVPPPAAKPWVPGSAVAPLLPVGLGGIEGASSGRIPNGAPSRMHVYAPPAAGQAPAPMPVPVDFQTTAVSHNRDPAAAASAGARTETKKNPREITGTSSAATATPNATRDANAANFFSSAGAMRSAAADGGGPGGIITAQPHLPQNGTTKPNGHSTPVTPGVGPTGCKGFSATQSAGPSALDFFGGAASATDTGVSASSVRSTPSAVAGAGVNAAAAFESANNRANVERGKAEYSRLSEDVGMKLKFAGAGMSTPRQIAQQQNEGKGMAVSASPREEVAAKGAMEVSGGKISPILTAPAAAIEPPPSATVGGVGSAFPSPSSTRITPASKLHGEVEGGSSFGTRQKPFRSRPTPPKPKLPLPPPTTSATRALPPVQQHHRRSGSSSSASSLNKSVQRTAPKFKIPPPLKLPKPPSSSGRKASGPSISEEIHLRLASAASVSATPTPPAPTSSPPGLPGSSYAPISADSSALSPQNSSVEVVSTSPSLMTGAATIPDVKGPRTDVDVSPSSAPAPAPVQTTLSPSPWGAEGAAIAATDTETTDSSLGVEEVMKSMVESVIDRTEAKLEKASMPKDGGRYIDGGFGRQPMDGMSYGSMPGSYQYVETAANAETSATLDMGLGVAPEDDIPEMLPLGPTNDESPMYPVTSCEESGARTNPVRDDSPKEQGVDARIAEGGSNVAFDGLVGDEKVKKATSGFEDPSPGGAVVLEGDEVENADTQSPTQLHALQENGTPEEDGLVVPSQNPADEVPLLPPDWAEFFDESSERAYYFNEVTQETTWERPQNKVAVSTVPAANTNTTAAPPRHDDDGIAPEDDVPTMKESADSGIYVAGNVHAQETDIASVENATDGFCDNDAHVETDLPDNATADACNVGSSLAPISDANDIAPEIDIPAKSVDDKGISEGSTSQIDPAAPAPAPAPLAAQQTDASSAPFKQSTASSETQRRPVSPRAAAIKGEGKEDRDATSVEEEDVSIASLPSGWKEVFDPASERVYYYNEETEVTTWQKPLCPERDTCGKGLLLSETQQCEEDSGEHDEADGCTVGEENDDGFALLETRQKVTGDEDSACEDGDGAVPGPTSSPTMHDEGGFTNIQQELNDDGTGVSRLEEEPGRGIEKTEGDADSDKLWDSKADIDVTDNREDKAAETTASSSSSLPAGWVESVDPSSGRPYYWHEGDGITTWELPLGAEDAGVPDEKSAEDAGVPGERIANDMWSATSGASAQKEFIPAVEDDALVPESEANRSQTRTKGESTEKVVEASEATYNGDALAAAIPPCGGIASTTAQRKLQRPPHALVSFGFGGRFCVMRPVPSGGLFRSNQTGVATTIESTDTNKSDTSSVSWQKGPVHVFRLHHIIDPRIVALPSISQGSFVGPWIGASDESSVWGHLRQRCQEGHGERSCEGDEPSQILWKLIQVAALSKGRLRSDEGAKDPQGPEAAVVNLLLGKDGNRQGDEKEAVNSVLSAAPQKHHPEGSSSESKGKSSAMNDVQLLLLRGRREEAVQRALAGHEYALALLVATMCDRRIYEGAARRFVDEAINPGSPLHTLAMLFSGQLKFSSGDRANDPGEESSGSGVGGGVTPKTFWGVSGDETLLHNWRYHLASILSNRTRGWDKLVRALGDQLLDRGSVAASHFCYMVGGCPVSAPTRNSRLVLVGCDCSTSMHAALMTRDGVESYERTEAFEWAKRRGNPTAAIPALQPFKLLYAMLLADFGYEERAKLYIESIRSCTGLQGGSGVSKANALYSSTFLDTINVFEDRVCVSLGTGPSWEREGGVGNTFDSSVANVVSSAFKDMSSPPGKADVVDGSMASDNRNGISASPIVHHDTALDASVVQRSEGAGLTVARQVLTSNSETGVASKGPVSGAPVRSSVESIKETNGDKTRDSEQPTFDASNPFAFRPSYQADSVEGAPAPSSISRKEAGNKAQPDMPPPINCAAVENEDTHKFSSPFGHVPSTAFPSATVSNKKGSRPNSGGQSFGEKPHHTLRDDSSLKGSLAPKSEGTGIQSAPPSIGKPVKVAKCQVDTPPVVEKVRAPPKSEGSILSKTKRPPSSGTSNQAPSSESKRTSWWTSKITKLLNPNATVCDPGLDNQAYYDEKLKRWIFPGDDPNEVAKPLAPPPTTPMSSPPAGPVLPCDNDDPLAALMAPPPRASATRSVARANYPVATMRPPSNSADTPSSDTGTKAPPKFPGA